MVDAYHPLLLSCLDAAHDDPQPAGPGSHRQLHAWHLALGGSLRVSPLMSWTSLGLLHAHLFIEDASDQWFDFPWALSSAWLARDYTRSVLYLHCVYPVGMRVQDAVHAFEPQAAVTIIATGDAWQAIAPLRKAVASDGSLLLAKPPARGPPVARIPAQPDLVRSFPLIVPLLCEQGENWSNLQDLWTHIHARLGERVWEYLPRGTRRYPHNGKTYLRHAKDLLVDACLFRQNLIRYDALRAHASELVLILKTSTPSSALTALSLCCPLLEAYQATDALLVRALGDSSLLDLLLTPSFQAMQPRVWLLDKERTRQEMRSVRVRYEHLFDPKTCTWRTA